MTLSSSSLRGVNAALPAHDGVLRPGLAGNLPAAYQALPDPDADPARERNGYDGCCLLHYSLHPFPELSLNG
jgi:hypothetical protein